MTSLYLRPAMFATEPFLGVRPASSYLFFLIASPVGAYYAEGLGPVKIRIEDQYVRAAPGGLGAVKAAANYIASLKAAEEAKQAGFAQVLWTDALEHAALEEVGTMNLFVRFGDEFATPALNGTILGGITRESVITLLRRWGFAVNERRILVEELLRARKSGALKEVFGTGTAAVISPVGELGWKEQRFLVGDGQSGEISQRLFKAITDIQYGRAPDPDGWMTVVE
jgi:branched-chain amino acid aminotransferase